MKEQIEKGIETKESEPKVSYEFLFLRHNLAMDAKIIKKRFEKAEVVCLELAGHSEEHKRFLNRLSQGLASELEIYNQAIRTLQPEFYQELFKTLSNSGKILEVVDVPRDYTNEIKGSKEALLKLQDAFLECYNNNTDKAIKALREGLDKLCAIAVIKREEYIISQIKNKFKPADIVKRYPQLKDKKEINILIEIGAIHTSLYHQLKKEGLIVSREFPNSPFIYDKFSELLRRKKFLPEKEMTDQEITEIFVGVSLLEDYFKAKFRNIANSSDIWLIINYLVRQRELPLKKFKSFQNVRQEIVDFYQDLLPKNTEEFNQVLKKIKEKYGRDK